MNIELVLLIFLISIIVVVLCLIFIKMKNQEKDLQNNKKLLVNSVSNNNIEHFKSNELNTLRDENDKLKKYMKVHGLYPQSPNTDLSKYILKSSIQPPEKCADMSQYVLKSSIPPPIRCPVINRDEWVRKTELPANWNKDCPKQPDLTNYVLKSTIPPTQKCPPCICPKIKVNAGLCRKPNKEDCVKAGVLDEACPKPKPCPLPKTTPCPRPPPPPKCPELKCPECPTTGKCPEPERCPPTQDCPKCYDVKYLKVPVVKSEPVPKPEKETIFPANLIETKLLKQHVENQPRQPRILKKKIEEVVENIDEPIENNIPNNLNIMMQNMMEQEEQLTPPPMATMPEPMAPAFMINNVNNNLDLKKKQLLSNNRKYKGKCPKLKLDKAYNKFGVHGFNNTL